MFLAPPEIDDDHSSDDIIVTEGYPITLTCRARGHPTPVIEWKREDGRPVRAQGSGIYSKSIFRYSNKSISNSNELICKIIILL